MSARLNLCKRRLQVASQSKRRQHITKGHTHRTQTRSTTASKPYPPAHPLQARRTDTPAQVPPLMSVRSRSQGKTNKQKKHAVTVSRINGTRSGALISPRSQGPTGHRATKSCMTSTFAMTPWSYPNVRPPSDAKAAQRSAYVLARKPASPGGPYAYAYE